MPSCAAVASGRFQYVDEHLSKGVLTTTLWKFSSQLHLLTAVTGVKIQH